MTYVFEELPCKLCCGKGVLEVIPNGGNVNDAIEEECPWCVRRQFENLMELSTQEITRLNAMVRQLREDAETVIDDYSSEIDRLVDALCVIIDQGNGNQLNYDEIREYAREVTSKKQTRYE